MFRGQEEGESTKETHKEQPQVQVQENSGEYSGLEDK